MNKDILVEALKLSLSLYHGIYCEPTRLDTASVTTQKVWCTHQDAKIIIIKSCTRHSLRCGCRHPIKVQKQKAYSLSYGCRHHVTLSKQKYLFNMITNISILSNRRNKRLTVIVANVDILQNR